MKFLAIALLSLLSFASQASSIGTCDGLDSIANLIGDPYHYGQGNVRVAYVSTEEPASHSDHLLIFIWGQEMRLDCFSINAGPDQEGFGGITMSQLDSSYDGNKGLLLTVPASVWTGEDGVYTEEILRVRINRSEAIPVVTLE